MEYLSTRTHGMIDYATALAIILLPLIFMSGDSGSAVAAWVLIVAGILLLGLSLLTRYELGVVKSIPMQVHLYMDMGLGALLIVSPWLFGFADVIWWPHVLVGLMEIGVAAITRRRSTLEASDALHGSARRQV